MAAKPGRKPVTLRKLARITACLTAYGPQTALQIAQATNIDSNHVRKLLTMDERFVVVDVVGVFRSQVWALKGDKRCTT